VLIALFGLSCMVLFDVTHQVSEFNMLYFGNSKITNTCCLLPWNKVKKRFFRLVIFAIDNEVDEVRVLQKQYNSYV